MDKEETIRKNITLYDDQYNFYKELKSKRLLVAFVEYLFEGIEPTDLKGVEKVAFNSLKIRMENQRKKALAGSVGGSNSSGGGRPRKASGELDQKNKQKTSTKQTKEQAKNNEVKVKDIKENIKEKRFEEFREAYPLKKGKAKAKERYSRAVKNGISEELLIQKAKEYSEEVKIKNTESRYIKRAEGWLNSGRYEDTYITAKPQTKQEDKPYDFLKPTLSKPKLPGITNLKKDY